jgi:NADPH2:quinone reductase
MSLSIVMTRPGGPEVFEAREADLPPPGPGEALIRHTASGVNFVDTYQRRGFYAVPECPAVLGVEGAGMVEAVGAGVRTVKPGDRVAWAGLPTGGYAEQRLIAAERLIPIPDWLPDRIAAAAMLRGLTAHMLLTLVWPVSRGDVLLVHAAAGGLGLILTQWAKRLGATVIGTVGTEEKAALAKSHGADHTILYRQTDFVEAVRELTGGQGIDFAIDGVGGTTLSKTLSTIRPFGMVAGVGQAGGQIPPIEMVELGPKRSIALSRPSVFAYVTDPARARAAAEALFAEIRKGLRITIGANFALREVAAAHRALEAGKTTGSILLE